MAAARERAALHVHAAGAQRGPVIHIKVADAEHMQSYRSHSSHHGAAGESDLTPGKVAVPGGVVRGLSVIGG
ncbi:hypothetical protein [Streptomyces sp. ALB3]|uniref:hypothetical protein n=1 Tax=Streptomyces sp. ALB3 TaxID=3374278 RepID=UPI0037B83FEB